MEGNATKRSSAASQHAQTRFGIHTPLQHIDVAGLTELWRVADDSGFDWISVWDHFVPVTPPPGGTDGDGDNHEAVSMHAALALTTRRARVGCLVYNVSYRSAAVIAKSAATIDHLSNGRAVVGLGAGYLQHEYERFGIEFPTVARRSALLAEATHEVRRLLDDVVSPSPVQARLPIIIGGGGERRTIPLAAASGDGWNIAMPTIEDFAHKNALVTAHAEAVGRNPVGIERTVSLGLCFDESRLAERFGARWEILRPAVLCGTTQQVVDKVGAYVEAGADTVILSLRQPFDADEIRRFSDEVMGALR